jgi:hypothetical protein
MVRKHHVTRRRVDLQCNLLITGFLYVETPVYLNCYVNRNANGDTYFWHLIWPYFRPELQHNLCILAAYTCTPMKLALTYLLITQIVLEEWDLLTEPDYLDYVSWCRDDVCLSGRQFCAYCLKEMSNVEEFCPFTCFHLESAARVYLKIGIVSWMKLILLYARVTQYLPLSFGFTS